MLYIREIHVRNHHKLPDFEVTLPEDDPERPSHLIITGPNASGKSTIVEALAQEMDRYVGDPNYTGRERHLVSTRAAWERELTNVTDEQARRHAESRLENLNDQLQNVYRVEVEWTDGNVGVEAQEGRFVSAYLPAARLDPFHQVAGPKDLDLGPISATEPAARHLLQHLVNAHVNARLSESESPDEAKAIFAWLERLDTHFAHLLGIEGLTLEFTRRPFAVTLREPDGATHSFHHLSAGHHSIVRMLGELVLRIDAAEELDRDNLTGVVIIDEPEAHLHPAIQERLLPYLTSLYPRLQFVVATHAPTIIASLENAKVVDLARPTGG